MAGDLLPHLRRARDHIDRHCRKTHEELSAKGVTFVQEPAERPYGVEAIIATTPATGWCWSSPASDWA